MIRMSDHMSWWDIMFIFGMVFPCTRTLKNCFKSGTITTDLTDTVLNKCS